MASLTGNLVAETYKALLKTIDNDILTASEKQITDGLGGGSNVFIDSQGFLRANKYKVTNGLATQFLKADGSLDANTYLTSITSAQVTTALGYTPVTDQRTLTINGVTYNLTANRSWTVEGTAAVWGNITGTLSNQTDLQAALNAKYNVPAGTISQYIRGDGSLATFPTLPGGLPTGGAAGQILAKIDATDYNTHWIDNYATQTKNEVKLGATLSKGAAVYVSSANGTNMIVSAASNTSEATSSKTFGLLETGGVTNDLVKCVTFGLIAGLDTSTASAGDPVWLGVNGALIFGLANKPVAPAHLVYIGVVTRVQSNNGEIFVNVQNGFELNEIHDVLIQSVANNQGLFYEASSGLWKNKSIATVLGYTPQAQLDGTGFVKASGTTITYDNSTYLTTTDAASTYQRLDNIASSLFASATNYPNNNAVIAGLALKADAANPVFTGSMNIVGLESRINFYDENNLRKYFIGYDSGTLRIFQDTGSASRFYITPTGQTFIPGTLTVGSVVKDGGTASQFLKADGSIDSNTYVSSSALADYLLISTATSTYQRLDNMAINLLASDTQYPNNNAVINALALKADAANPVFTGNMTISGAEPKLYFVDTDQNPDYTVFIDSGFFYIYDQTAGATRFSINSSGNISTGVGKSITAGSFIKDGGTSSQVLMADGSVSALPSLSGYVPYTGATTSLNLGSYAITANRIYGNYSTILNTYTTVNPSTNVLLMSAPNDRDAWIFLDQADTGSNWGIYHRNIDSAVGGLPANAIGYIGGGANILQAYISLGSGNGYFAGNLLLGTTTDAGQRLQVNGTSVFNDNMTLNKNNGYFILNRTTTTNFLGLGYRTANSAKWFVGMRENSTDNYIIYNESTASDVFTINNGSNLSTFANSVTISSGTLVTPKININAGATSEFSFTINQQSGFAFGSTNGRRIAYLGNYSLDDNGLQFGYDTVDKTGIIAGAATSAGAGIDFYTYNGSAWANRVRITKDGNSLFNTTTNSTTGGFTNTSVLIKQIADGVAGGGLQIEANGSDNVAFFGFDGGAFRIGTSYRSTGSYQPIDLTTNGSIRLRISTTGNLLVGTTSDSGYKLDVNGTGRYIGRLTITDTGSAYPIVLNNQNNEQYLSIESAVAREAMTRYYNPTAGNWYTGIRSSNGISSGSSYHIYSSIYSGDVLACDVGGNTILAGKLLMGYTSLGSSLIQVNGNIRMGTWTTAGSRYLGFTRDDDGTWAVGGASGFEIESVSVVGNYSQNVHLWTHWYNNGSRRALTARYDGNVGIGTTTPSSRLSLGTGIGPKLLVYDNGSSVYSGLGQDVAAGNSTDLFCHGVSNLGFLTFGRLGTDKVTYSEWMRIDVNGRVGIGTSSPNAVRTEIKESASGNPTLGTASGNLMLSQNGLWGTFFGLNGSTGNGWIQQMRADSAVAYNLMLQPVGGNVLINTTTDNGYKLNVNGKGYYSNNILVVPQSEAWAEGLSFVMTSTNTWGGLRWRRERSNYDGNWYMGYVGFDSTDDLVFGVNNGGSQINNVLRLTKAGNVSSQGSITATSFFESSDLRLKTLIESNPIIDGIEKLEAKLYEKNGKIELGYFAQDAELIMPYAVTKNEDGFLNLSYREIHTAKIARLEKEVAELKAQLNLN